MGVELNLVKLKIAPFTTVVYFYFIARRGIFKNSLQDKLIVFSQLFTYDFPNMAQMPPPPPWNGSY